MSTPQTAPEDRVPFLHMVVYGLGGFANNFLSAAIGGMLIVLNIGLGMNPALVGLIGAIPRLTDAITDPVVGYVSDTTRTRWGRRRPFIFVGAIFAAISLVLLWQFPRSWDLSSIYWYVLIGSFVFYLAYTVYATPWVALGYELTPDYNERTRLMGVQNFFAQVPWVIAPWFLAFMQYDPWFGDDMLLGARWLAVGVGAVVVVLGVLPAIVLRERFAETKPAAAEPKLSIPEKLRDFFGGFAQTLKVVPFLKLALATFLVFNGFMLIAAFQSYVLIYYVCGGDVEAGAKVLGLAGTVGAVANFAIIVFITWLGTKVGKRRAMSFALAVCMVGHALKWFCYSPEHPWLIALPAPLISFGLAGLFTLVGSMIADVCDVDELETGERREGMFGSIFWWVVKLGMSAALAGGGLLLNATGFDVALEGNQSEQTLLLLRVFDVVLPVITTGIALAAVWSYGLTEARMAEVRTALEARRGTFPVETGSDS